MAVRREPLYTALLSARGDAEVHFAPGRLLSSKIGRTGEMGNGIKGDAKRWRTEVESGGKGHRSVLKSGRRPKRRR